MHMFMSQMNSNPLLLGLFLIATFFAFVIASTFGMGGPLLLIPVLMLRLPAAQAIAVVVPVQLSHNLLMLIVQRRYVQVRAALFIGASALPTALIAAFFTGRVDAHWLKFGLGILMLAILFHQYLLKRLFTLNKRGLVGWGALIGILSGLTGNAGPTTALVMKGYGLQGRQLVGTIACLQLSLQLVRLPAYLATGILPSALWPLAILLSGVALIAIVVGQRLLSRLKGDTFRVFFDGFLLLMALWLFFTAFRT